MGFDGLKQEPLSCLRRTQREIKSLCALDCVRCEKTWRSSFVEIENEVHLRDDGWGEVEWTADDTNGVELVAVGGFGGFDGFDGVDGTVDGLVASMASMASMVWRRSPMVNWGLRHRGH